MAEDEEFAQARKYAKAKFGFYVHLVVYLVVIGILASINLLTNPGYFWFVWPAFGWGIALVLHAASAFLMSQKETIIDTIARRELDKQESKRRR
tara:strand:- start:2802 stop:3083 length:282 start_codon:yes stop_codon:yes gene_type:complete